MYHLFRPKRRASALTYRRAELRLEPLDNRIVPSAPAISSLNGEIIGNEIIIFGKESGSSSSGSGDCTPDTVTISGAINQSTSVSNSGQFTFAAPYTGNGNVSIYGQDAFGSQSSSYTLLVVPTSNPAPVITLQVVNNDNGSFTLSGKVFDANPGSLPVVFSGGVSATATTDSDGSFSLTTQPSQTGMVYVVTTDASDNSSNTADIVVSPTPPVIQGFGYTQASSGKYVFTGQVISPTAPGSTVTLVSSNPAFNGAPGTVNDDGTFTIIVTVPTGGDNGGTVGVTTTDPSGQASNSPSVTILN